ncbi:hypothetical protein BGX30_003386, partial [Mortierella sp. GBA39]
MDLPEIRHEVARYLDRSSLAAAASVCKSWNTTFTPFLYSKILDSFEGFCTAGFVANAHHIRELYLDNAFFTGGWPMFFRLEKIRIDTPDYVSAINCLSIVKRCPQLQSLEWDFYRYGGADFSADVFCGLFSTCPHFEGLNLGRSMEDEHLASILDTCPSLQSLTAKVYGDSYHQAFQSLTRHFATLAVLHLEGFNGITSTMNLRVLTSCFGLTEFSSTELEARDVLGVIDIDDYEDGFNAQQALHPQDWACINLKSLKLYICGLRGRRTGWQQMVLRQLARLTKLQDLRIGIAYGRQTSRDGIDLRLEAGLDILSSLESLADLHIDYLWQQMDEQDVRWMLRAWP